jgi:hypothetical protein
VLVKIDDLLLVADNEPKVVMDYVASWPWYMLKPGSVKEVSKFCIDACGAEDPDKRTRISFVELCLQRPM